VGDVERKDDADWVKGTSEENLGRNVSERIQRVLACPTNMLRIGING